MENKSKNTISSFFSIAIGLIIVSIVGAYIYHRVNNLDIPDSTVKGSNNENSEAEETTETEPANTEEIEIPENNELTYNETPVYEDGTFFEKLPVISDQQAYIAHPLTIDLNNPPTIIIYSHGSITNVTTNMEEQMMIDLRSYGEYFTEKGYIFAASNQHGENWGDDLSVADTKNLINWINENYVADNKVNLLGYSMGGLPTMNYATNYPETLNKIALLAPTSYYTEWNKARFEGIQYTPVGIWHGNADVNVPWNLSNNLTTLAESYEMTNWTLNTIDGATHWDVDTELMDEIYEFYTN